MTAPDVREQLLDVISFTECANQGTTPDALINALGDSILRGAAASLPFGAPKRGPEFAAGVAWAAAMLQMIAGGGAYQVAPCCRQYPVPPGHEGLCPLCRADQQTEEA